MKIHNKAITLQLSCNILDFLDKCAKESSKKLKDNVTVQEVIRTIIIEKYPELACQCGKGCKNGML